ncbi:MarR family winged helix-turn-helix transcriptional regulator [Desulfosarcina sp.]|uniref:MarR family winged helix-turn-helix transcriptional regulator n=1 Tax=Desulfosarcina sp. TaxID=2027861 RepID=UPI0035657A1C
METGSHIRLVLWKAAKAVNRVDRESIRRTGLTLSDFAIMEALLHKGPLPINQIGEKVLLSSGSMTAAVNRLEEAGHVQRIQDPSDGRCFFVHLTKSGRRVVSKAFQQHARNLEKAAGALTGDERTELVRLLKKIGFQARQITLDD